MQHAMTCKLFSRLINAQATVLFPGRNLVRIRKSSKNQLFASFGIDGRYIEYEVIVLLHLKITCNFLIIQAAADQPLNNLHR